MGWGTEFKAYIYLNRQAYNSPEEVDEKLINIQDDIDYIEKKLIALIAMTHTPTENETAGDVTTSIISDFDEMMGWYRELIIQKYNLRMYRDYLSNIEPLEEKE